MCTPKLSVMCPIQEKELSSEYRFSFFFLTLLLFIIFHNHVLLNSFGFKKPS
jgi:hypothetical protein